MNLLSRLQPRQVRSKGPPGRRAYVIGDIHGRLDLLERLLAKIHDDLERRPAAKTTLVFVGDLIDRGPSSAQVIERLRTYRHPRTRALFLLGNHEEVLLRILNGDPGPIAGWLRFGGAQCLASYGVGADELAGRDSRAVMELVRRSVPSSHVEFLKSFADTCRFGDYLFVHAGIRPGVALELQTQSDLRWIRQPFLGHDGSHGFIVVHGHTITNGVDEQHNRIGIDTGAYRTHVLTALAIEGDRRWLLDTADAVGGGAAPLAQ